MLLYFCLKLRARSLDDESDNTLWQAFTSNEKLSTAKERPVESVAFIQN